MVGTGSVEQKHLARRVGGLLSQRFTDVEPKLARQSGVDERNALIWTNITSDGVPTPFFAGHFELEPHDHTHHAFRTV